MTLRRRSNSHSATTHDQGRSTPSFLVSKEHYQSCYQETPGGRSRLAKEQAAPARVGDDNEKQDVADGAAVTRKKSVLREPSEWTVIQEIAEPDSSHRIEDVEEEHDQLVEDEEYELRDEMEAADVV